MKKLALVTAIALAVGIFAVPYASANDKPRIAVLEFTNKADAQYYHCGTTAARPRCRTSSSRRLVKSKKFRVIDREALAALMREKNLALSGDVDPSTAVKAGRLLGVQYLLVGAVTEYGKTDASAHGRGIKRLPGFRAGKSTFVAAANARLIDAETGEIVWADEARGEDSKVKVSVGGFGGGVDRDQRMFDKVMKPIVAELAASIKAADL